MRKLLVYFSFTFSFIRNTWAQTNDFAESFYFFNNHSFLLNPALAGKGNDVQANVAYRTYFGELSAIRAYVADINLNVQDKTLSFPEFDKHMLGAGVYTEREGDFINRSRALIRYAWHTQLREEVFLSGGASFQVINYLFRAASAGSNGSGFGASGSLGAALYGPTFHLGLAINDINQPSIRPIDVASVVYRFYTGHAEKQFQLGKETKMIGSFRGNFIPGGFSTGLFLLGIKYSEKIGLNVLVHSTLGWGVALELNHLEVGASWLDVSFGYRVPYANENRIPYNSLEINIGYYLSKSEGNY